MDAPNMELNNCRFVKTILMFLVILYHSIVFWSGDWFTIEKIAFPSNSLSIFSQWLNSFHVYAFTLVSGYIFFSLKIENGKYQKYGMFLINKLKRLVLPACFITLLWVIPISVYFYHYKLDEIITKFLLANSPSQLWFLWMLFWVFVLFWPLSSVFKRSNIFVGVQLINVNR